MSCKVNITLNIECPDKQVLVVYLPAQCHGFIPQAHRKIEFSSMKMEVCRAEKQFCQNSFVTKIAGLLQEDLAPLQSFYEMAVQVPEQAEARGKPDAGLQVG